MLIVTQQHECHQPKYLKMAKGQVSILCKVSFSMTEDYLKFCNLKNSSIYWYCNETFFFCRCSNLWVQSTKSSQQGEQGVSLTFPRDLSLRWDTMLENDLNYHQQIWQVSTITVPTITAPILHPFIFWLLLNKQYCFLSRLHPIRKCSTVEGRNSPGLYSEICHLRQSQHSPTVIY